MKRFCFSAPQRLLALLALTLVSLVGHTPAAQAKDVYVRGHYRSNGSYVEPHIRTRPDTWRSNNYSYPGNTNPYSGRTAPSGDGTRYVPGYYRSNGTYVRSHFRR